MIIRDALRLGSEARTGLPRAGPRPPRSVHRRRGGQWGRIGYRRRRPSLGTGNQTDRPSQKVEISNRPWVRIVLLDAEQWSGEGLCRRGDSSVVLPWSRVLRVAVGYEIHPIAIADWEFWAFQTEEPDVTYWAYAEPNSPFSDEVRRRFGIGDAPPMADWDDREFCVRAYVLWPEQDAGGPMYVTVKRHWWSWTAKLAYANAMGTRLLPIPSSG
jgi:hypothetical protein